MAKTQAEMEADILKQQQKLEEMKKKLAAAKKREAEEKRKADAHNKIVLGGAVLSVLGREYADGDENRLIAFLKNQNERGGYFDKAMKLPEETPTEMEKKDDDFDGSYYSENSNSETTFNY